MAVFSICIKGHCLASSASRLHFRGGTRDPSASLWQPEHALVCVCVHTHVSKHARRHTINSLLKMCPHRSVQKVRMLEHKLHKLYLGDLGVNITSVFKVGSCMSHYRGNQRTRTQQEVTWTECQNPDRSLCIHKVIHKQYHKHCTAKQDYTKIPIVIYDIGLNCQTGSEV